MPMKKLLLTGALLIGMFSFLQAQTIGGVYIPPDMQVQCKPRTALVHQVVPDLPAVFGPAQGILQFMLPLLPAIPAEEMPPALYDYKLCSKNQKAINLGLPALPVKNH